MAVYMNHRLVMPELEPPDLNPFVVAPGVVEVRVGVSNPAFSSNARIVNRTERSLTFSNDGASTRVAPGELFSVAFDNDEDGEQHHTAVVVVSGKREPMVAMIALVVTNGPVLQNAADFMCSVATP